MKIYNWKYIIIGTKKIATVLEIDIAHYTNYTN